MGTSVDAKLIVKPCNLKINYMNTQSTIDKMRQLRLNGMSDLYQRAIKENLFTNSSNDEFIALMVDTEWENRQNIKINNLVKGAGFKLSVSSLNIDYASNRNLDRNMFERLLTLQFLKQNENVIITGSTGVGKSYLAQCIGRNACEQGDKTLFLNCGQLIEKVKLSMIEGTYIKFLKKLHSFDLLILDDFGLHAFDNQSRQALMDIIEDRHDRVSTLVTSQIPVANWHETIGEGTIADAILDRLVYSSHRIELSGESLRKRKKLKG
jgi:DNA replication protein DnaC